MGITPFMIMVQVAGKTIIDQNERIITGGVMLVKKINTLLFFLLLMPALCLSGETAQFYYEQGFDKNFNQGDYHGAIQDFNKSIELDPQNSFAYINRGSAKSNLKDYRGAIQDYSKSIVLNPKNSIAYYNRGNAKSSLKDYRGAIQDCSKAIELMPNNNDGYKDMKCSAYIVKGESEIYLKNYRGAIDAFTNAINLGYQDYSAYFNRGIAKFNLRNKDGACLDWSKAGELGAEGAYDMIKKYCQ
jgi:tetratricopeptide (TPR) repeat protein